MAASRTQRFGPGMAVRQRKGLAPRREEVPRGFWAGRYGIEKGRPLGGKREESREKREERREKRENGRQLDSLHFYGVPCPPQRSYENQQGPPKKLQARFTAFLQCPVTTSMRAQKTPTSVRGYLSQNYCKAEGATKMVASSNPSIFIVSRDHLDGGKNATKKASNFTGIFEKTIF